MFEVNREYPQKDTHDYPLPSFFKYNKRLSAFSGRALFFLKNYSHGVVPTTANLPYLKPFYYLALSGFNLFGFYTNRCYLPMTFYLYALLLNE